MKIFNLMKGFFGKPMEAAAEDVAVNAYMAIESAPPATQNSFGFAQATADSRSLEPVASTSSPRTGEESTENVMLPLSSLISSLPVELQQQVIIERLGETRIGFPLDKIIPQLALGLVRATFGEIRNSAPDAFSPGSDKDFMMVTLPLAELVGRLGPALLTRQSRKQVEVPDEIASPFGERGQGLMLSKDPANTPLTCRPRGARSAAPVPPAADPRARGNVTSVPKPAPPGTSTSFDPRPPAAPVRPEMTADRPVASPIPFTTPPKPSNGSNGFHPPAAPQSFVSMPAESNLICFTLATLSGAFPEAVRLEIAQLNSANARVALPADQVEAGLKRGKVVFSWKQLRSWIAPAVAPGISAHDGLMLNMPLAIIAPRFLSRQKELGCKEKRIVKVDDKIPNLFFGFPQPEVAPVAPVPCERPLLPTPESSETNYFVWDDDKEQARIEGDPAAQDQPVRPAVPPGTTFSSRKATPNEVVMKASMLEGVYGALVVLQDGLLVACKLDPSQIGDTIAALIPQMYSKLSGCTKELRMGELNNLNFTVGNVPWKIFRVNGIFFAAFGCAGEPLPTAHLAELAAELDYKKAK